MTLGLQEVGETIFIFLMIMASMAACGFAGYVCGLIYAKRAAAKQANQNNSRNNNDIRK